jgi:hypothetical protein
VVKVGKIQVVSGRVGNGSWKMEVARNMDGDKGERLSSFSPHNMMMRTDPVSETLCISSTADAIFVWWTVKT